MLPGSICCPVSARKAYTSMVTPFKDAPAFLLSTGVPLCHPTLLRALKLASLFVNGINKGCTLHSLRMGATQTCQAVGLELGPIMQAGSWHSKAVLAYLNSSLVSLVPTVLGSMLG